MKNNDLRNIEEEKITSYRLPLFVGGGTVAGLLMGIALAHGVGNAVVLAFTVTLGLVLGTVVGLVEDNITR